MKARSVVYMMVLAGFASLPARVVSGGELKQEQVSKSGDVPRDGIHPKDGFVPDATTAIGIATVVLKSIYGAEEIDKQKPFSAVLRGDVWVVQGSMTHATGIAEVDLSKRTGAVLRVIHGK